MYGEEWYVPHLFKCVMYVVLLLKFFIELVQTLVWTSNGLPLELVCHVDTDLFEDAFEEEEIKRQGITNSRFEKMEITEHLI
jgi:hypothetical protein